MRSAYVVAVVAWLSPLVAFAQDASPARAAASCAAPGTPECPTYQHYENRRFGFGVDMPAFFVRKPADADGRGQPFEYGVKARARAWAMFDNPPMTAEQLYSDWTRRDGVTFKALTGNTWVVRGKDAGRYYYSRSILAEGVISTIEISYAPELADTFEPILARIGASLLVVPGAGARARAH